MGVEVESEDVHERLKSDDIEIMQKICDTC